MDKIGLVCTSCAKVDSGDGIWSKPDDDSVCNYKEILCPNCCHQRFPKFYIDFKPHEKGRSKVAGLLSFFKYLRRA